MLSLLFIMLHRSVCVVSFAAILSLPQEPITGYVHMLCAPQGSPLSEHLKRKFGFLPSAEATVLAYRMPDVDFSFVLTSDI